jgi:hypothetical protein
LWNFSPVFAGIAIYLEVKILPYITFSVLEKCYTPRGGEYIPEGLKKRKYTMKIRVAIVSFYTNAAGSSNRLSC